MGLIAGAAVATAVVAFLAAVVYVGTALGGVLGKASIEVFSSRGLILLLIFLTAFLWAKENVEELLEPSAG